MRQFALNLMTIIIPAAFLACGIPTPQPTQDIDATVEARVQGTPEAKSTIEPTVRAEAAVTPTRPFPTATLLLAERIYPLGNALA